MANNESNVSKTNTLEQWRQKTNAVSHHLGDVDQLDGRLTDKVYTYTNTSEFVFVNDDADAGSKNLRFEIKPEESLDAPATIILTGSPTIPASFVAGITLYQGTSGSETFTGIIQYTNVNKISLKNTTGSFNASLPLKYSTDTLAANKLLRLVSESYKVGYVNATQDNVIAYQELRQDGFHVPNIGLRVVLTGSPSIPASFTEGAIITQSGGFSGTLYKATTSELYIKSFTGTFNPSQNAGVPHTDAANRILASAISTFAVLDNSIGNVVEFHTIPTSDTVVITSTNAIDAITELQDDIGEITSLGTTDKSDVVSSINELETASRGTNSNYTLSTTAQNFRDAIIEHETDIGNMTFTGLSATDISAALRELRVELGDHASLGTTATSNAVGAINELETAVRGSAGNYTIGTNANDLVAAINEIETVLRAGNSDYALTTTAQNVRDAIREHEGDIGNMTFTGLSATDISAALRELRAELGDHSTINNLTGYSATTAATGIVEIQGDIGNIDNMTTSATKIVLAINELDLKQGSAALGTTATTLSGAVNEFETALRGTNANYTLGTTATNFRDAVNELETAARGTNANYTLTTVAQNFRDAINEHETQINTLDTNHLNRNLASGVNQDVNGTITFRGDSVDFSNTTALFSAAGGVANFGSAFVNLNATAASGANVNIQGLQVDRTSLTGSNPKHDVRLVWNETLVNSKPARAWQLRGMADDKSDTTFDIVTFYNAKDLVANNTESGIAVTWDPTNQNFDFNVTDPTLTFTSSTLRSSGNLGSGTITNLGNTSFALTANQLDLGYSEHIKLGGSDEFQIYNNNTDSVISSTDPINILTDLFRLNNAANSKNMITATNGGDVKLYFNHSPKLATKTDGINVSGELEATSLDINGNADISGNLVTHGTLNVYGNTTLGNASSDTVSVPGNLTITGDLTVNGTNTVLNTATLEVEDTLILTGTSSTEPTTGGFGIETRSFTGVGTHAGNASNVTGSHSFVYNFQQDRWEADGNMILDTVNSIIIPQVKINSGTPIDMTAARDLNLINGTGIGITGGLSGTDINFTITHDRLAPNENIFKNITADSGGTATANINNDTLNLLGGIALESARASDTITFNHSNVGAGAATYGEADAEDGTYIKSVTINAQGHVTAVTDDNFDDRYVKEDETSKTNTANFVVRRDGNTIRATTFSGNLSGNVTGNVTGNVSGSSGSTTGNAASSSTLYVTSDESDSTFREVPWITGSGGGNTQFYADSGLTYRSSDNILRATTFEGALSGNASTSSQVYVTGTATNSNYRLIFGENNDGYNGYETLYKDTDAGLYYNPALNNLTSGTFTGALVGNADTATWADTVDVNNSDADANYRAVWHNGDVLASTAGITFHPGNNTISATRFYGAVTGALTGNVTGNVSGSSGSCTGNAATATSAGSATSATNSTKVFVNNYSGATTMRILGSHDGINTHGNVYSTPQVYVNMSTNVIYATTFSGALSGNATTATTAGSITSQANSATITAYPANVGNGIVRRDSAGGFSAGTITAALSGNATTATTAASCSGNAASATTLYINENSGYNVACYIAGFPGGNTDGYKNAQTDSAIYFNPYQNRLYATYFQGTLTGSSTSCTGNSASASVASTVTINYNNNSNSTYQMLWGSGNSVYGTGGVYVNPATNTIYATGDVVAAASDDRLKDKKGNIENALEKVNSLNGFHYTWNDKAVELEFKTTEQQEENHIGLSAQDVKAVAPELTTESAIKGYDTVRYDKLTALLVEAVKELTEQNKQMKAEIESLKSINS